MKKLLYIDCCMRDTSRTRRLADAYLGALEPGEYDVQRLKLAGLPLAPLNPQTLRARDADLRAGRLDKDAYALARDFAAADQIVIAAPYWDASFPATLKIYLEQICVNGITFGYDSAGAPVKWCRAERLVYITTSGGFLPRRASVQAYLEELGAMFCIGDVRFYCAQGLDVFPERVESTLQETIREMTAAPCTLTD